MPPTQQQAEFKEGLLLAAAILTVAYPNAVPSTNAAGQQLTAEQSMLDQFERMYGFMLQAWGDETIFTTPPAINPLAAAQTPKPAVSTQTSQTVSAQQNALATALQTLAANLPAILAAIPGAAPAAAVAVAAQPTLQSIAGATTGS
jgi:hypothetical protein